MLGLSTRNFGNVITLYLRGKIVIGQTDSLRKVVASSLEASVIVLDLELVSAIDAHGIGVLLELRRQAESRGIEFRLRNVTEMVGRVLEITRMNSVFNMSMQAEALSRMQFCRPSSLRELRTCA